MWQNDAKVVVENDASSTVKMKQLVDMMAVTAHANSTTLETESKKLKLTNAVVSDEGLDDEIVLLLSGTMWALGLGM